MTRMTGEAESHAKPEDVWRVLVDPGRMNEWFTGAKDVQTADGWPAVGGKLRWRVGPTKFEARVTDAAPPRYLRMAVDTPSARSDITHRIEDAPPGVRIEKVVDAQWKGALGPLFGKLVIGPSVKREVKRVAKAAEHPSS